MRRRSTVARISSSYLRSRLAAALSPDGRLAEADCGVESSLASSGLGGRTFSVGRCRGGWIALPEPKADPLPEPKSDRGMLRCLEAEGRCSVDSIWTQGDEDGSLVGV
jgi:hypothetical protein